VVYSPVGAGDGVDDDADHDVDEAADLVASGTGEHR
jgi:hypothetical protein